MSTSINKSAESCVLSAELKSTQPLIPLPELPIQVRLASNDDIPFMDELQKKNNKNLGFMPRGTLEGKIRLGEVLIAEEVVSSELPVVSEDTGGVPTVAPKPDFGTGGVPTVAPIDGNVRSGLATNHWPLATRLGYLIGNDRYFKRDELGCIFQLCVVPNKRRGLIGATLLKSLFERASYGTRLYCCWCAQDLDANHFWESMGFIPLAFRSGSRNKIKGKDGKNHPRVHIYWIKRIRSGDVTTPLWYPSQTSGGAIGEDRLVLPIPPGTHWSEVKSVVLPGSEFVARSSEFGGKMIEHDPNANVSNAERRTPKSELSTQNSAPSTEAKRPPAPVVTVGTLGGWGIGKKVESKKVKEPKAKAPKIKQKNDPAKVKAARFMRDRYLEEINENPTQNPSLISNGKYDVSRVIGSKVEVSVKQVESKVVGMIAA